MPVSEETMRTAAKILAARVVAKGATHHAAPANAPKADHHAQATEAQEYSYLLNGFNALVNSAIREDGKTLDSLSFDRNLKSGDRTLLEQVRHVFIDAQAGADGHKKAQSAWPPIEAKLHRAVAKARSLGVAVDYLDSTEDNIAAVAEGYIKVAHKGPSEMESAADYGDLLDGIQDLLTAVEQSWTDMTSGARALDKDQVDAKQRSLINGVKFGTRMSKRHHQLLEDLRHVLIVARTGGRAHDAVTAWNHLNQDLTHVLKRIGALGLGSTQSVAGRLNKIHIDLIEGSAYTEDHQKAKAKTWVHNPNDTLDEQRLKEAIQSLEKADELVKKGEELTSKAILQGVFEQHGMKSELVGLLFEYGHGGFEIKELLEEWKEKGLIGKGITVASLADKVVSTSKAAMEATFTYIKEFAEGAAEEAAEDLAKEWESIGKWADKNLEALKTLAKVATAITIAVSAIKVVNHLIHGRVLDAVKEAASTVIGIGVGAAAGAAGTAFFAGIALAIEAEIEGLKGAAAMIEYARDENQKLALGAFFATMNFASDAEAQDLVADLKVLAEAADHNERRIASANLESAGRAWAKDLADLSQQVHNDRKDRIGGQPDLLEKLGGPAVAIMRNGVASNTPDGMGEQIRTVFDGANELARWVAKERTEKRQQQEKERQQAEEEEKE